MRATEKNLVIKKNVDERKSAVKCDNYYANAILLIKMAERYARYKSICLWWTDEEKKLGNSVNITLDILNRFKISLAAQSKSIEQPSTQHFPC